MALSYSGISGSIGQSKRTIKKISNIVSSSTVTKTNLSNSISRYRTQRLEDQRRQQTKTELGAPIQVLRTGGAKSLSLSASGGSLGSRLVGFIGYVSAGWILSNMPTWISGAKQLRDRVTSLNSTFNGIGNDLSRFMGDMSSLTGSLSSNLKNKDFRDDSKLVKNSMGDLNDTVSSLGDKLSTVFSTLLQPLTNLTPLGTKGEEGAYPDVSAGGGARTGGVSVSGNLTETQKQALNILSKYESAGAGGYNAVNQIGTKGGRGVKGYSGDFRNMSQHGGKSLTDMTIADIMRLQADDRTMSDQQWINAGKLHAVGRYQFIGSTLPGVVKRSGIPTTAKFTPEVQDLLALQLLKESGIGQWVGPSDKATRQERAIIAQARQEPIKKPTITSGTSDTQVAAAPSQSTPSQAKVASQPTTSSPAGAAKIAQAATELKGTSTQAGPGNGSLACVYAINMVFAKAGIKTPWGSALRVSNAESAMIRAGWKEVPINQRKAGDIIIIYDNDPTEPQIHIGVVLANGNMLSNSTSRGSFTWEDSPENVFKTYGAKAYGKCYRMPGGDASQAQVAGVQPQQTMAGITPFSQAGGSDVTIDSNSNTVMAGVLKALESEEQGQEIVFINDLEQPSTSETMSPSGGSSGGGTSTISESEVVNMYIKQKLLLDLNYL